MTQTAYAVLYLEINLISVALVGIIRYRTMGLSRMVSQRNLSMALDAEMLLFLSDTFCMMIQIGLLPLGAAALMAGKIVYFMATGLTCFFWFLYFEHIQASRFAMTRRSAVACSAFVWIMGALQIVNLFTGVLFRVEDALKYIRGPLFWTQYFLSYTYVLFASAHALLNACKKERYAQRGTLTSLALFPVPPAIAGLVQYFYPHLPLVCAALALETLVIYLQWIDQMISVDPLTRLNNRKQLEHNYQLWNQNTDSGSRLYLLLIDANRFKSINDTYGHVEGDAALVRIADALRLGCKDFPRRVNIARYGGDEFTVLALAKDPEEIRTLGRRINEELDALNREAQTPYQVSVSIGMACADAEQPLKDLIARADEQLYEEKKRR